MKRFNDNVMDESKQRDLEHRDAMTKLTDKFEASRQIAEDSAAECLVLRNAATSSEDKVKQSEQYVEKLRAIVSELQHQQQTGTLHRKWENVKKRTPLRGMLLILCHSNLNLRIPFGNCCDKLKARACGL